MPAAFLTARPFAHRGLHGAGRVENGMAAFRAAIAAGHSIECDVRLSRDGVAMVFHDARLDRLTAERGAFADRDADALAATGLVATGLADGGTIPRLADLLALAAHAATPLLVEIKVDGRRVAPICAAVRGDLSRRPAAPVAIMSFNPLAVRWFARHAPAVMRGLVVAERDRRGAPGRGRGRLQRALALRLSRPDFLACDISDLPSAFAAHARARGLPVLSWTVRTAEQRRRAAAHADQIIFEGEARP